MKRLNKCIKCRLLSGPCYLKMPARFLGIVAYTLWGVAVSLRKRKIQIEQHQVNPLSFKSDQHQISPQNINT